jgi:glycosyltransferase involved in cell wall biosynthesis
VIGVPLYHLTEHREAALGSLLAQRFTDFELLLVDDAPSEEAEKAARELCARDARVHYVRNERRLGMTGNWRRCFELARERHPEAEYFAWGSDHDRWEPEWLAALVEALDADPQVVLAYPVIDIVDADDTVLVPNVGELDTTGESDPAERVRRTYLEMSAGNMVYGLFRAEAIEAAGVFRNVIGPDRLLLVELSFRGSFRQVPRVLWHRRFRKLFTQGRQRRTIWLDRPPVWSYLAPWRTHLAALAWLYVVRPRPGFDRPTGLRLVRAVQRANRVKVWQGRRKRIRIAWKNEVVKPARRTRKRVRNRVLQTRHRVAVLVGRSSARID